MAKHNEMTNNCPVCKKVTVAKYRPFCSKRCADVDLAKWLKGSYAIPGEVAVSEEAFDAIDQMPHPGRVH